MLINPSIEQHEEKRRDKMSQVSLTKGYWFFFEHEGNDISMFGSVWNGKENVSFNNEIVSSFRNLNKFKSEHSFSKNGHNYKVCTHMTNMLRGTLVVSLYCDDELLQTETLSQIGKDKPSKRFFSKTFLWFLVFGFAVGMLAGYFNLFG